MSHRWLSAITSSVPTGLSRYYILDLLARNNRMTAEEIIEKVIIDGRGKWKPSVEVVYSFLIRLLQEGLINEGVKDGRYEITEKGIDIVTTIQLARNILPKAINCVLKIGNKGKMMVTTTATMDLLDKTSNRIKSVLTNNLRARAHEKEKETKEQKLEV
jgi:DNA-binding PadR family transcriptional regulator